MIFAQGHTVWFEVTTARGATHYGPIHGSGGVIGAGATHLTAKEQQRYALERLRRQVKLANAREPLHVFEPRPGCVALYPKYGAAEDGPQVIVSLRGARVHLARRKP